jgi:glycosyltransferase involved in cell wall biosynthesis
MIAHGPRAWRALSARPPSIGYNDPAMRLVFAESSIRGYGTEQHAAALASAMARAGHEVLSLACAGSPIERLLREQGVPLAAVRPGPARGLRIAARLAAITLRHRPQWLVSNDPRFYRMFLALRRLTGSRVALFRHWHDAPTKPRARELLSRRADRFILVSRFQLEDYRRQGMDVARASILYNPIDTSRFHPSVAARTRTRATLGLAEPEILIGYIGRISEAKGVFTLLEAAERFLPAVPGAHLLWLGDGEALPPLKRRAAASASRARHLFRGWEADTAALYPALDVLVVPSVYPEPFGRVSVEAQAAGVPVVCSSVGGLPETYRRGVTGLEFQAEDAAGLARAVLALSGDRALRERMGAAAREWACARFSFERIACDFEKLLREDVAQRIAPD